MTNNMHPRALGRVAHWAIVLAFMANGRALCSELERGVAALVDERPITWNDVDRRVRRTLGDREATSAALAELRRVAREQLISRELILSYLAAHQVAPSSQDVDDEVTRIRKRLAVDEQTLESYLEKSQVSEAEFRNTLRWQLGWQWYLDRYLTDENLQRHFRQHRRQFDGTRLRVAQILFKADVSNANSVAAAQAEAKKVKAEIDREALTFAEAAKKHSSAPSGAKGGDIGWIERHEPMQESFSKAAFALEPNEISAPVVTAVGVHLIQCLEVEPGQRTWQAVREPLRVAVTAHLFRWVAEQQRPKSKITRAP